MDEWGLPVRPPSKTFGYVVLVCLVACAIASAGYLRQRAPLPRAEGVLGVGIAVGSLPLAAGFVKPSDTSSD